MLGTNAFEVRKNSCERCFKRKVKCDKTVPSCSHCTRQAVSCSYQEPARRKRAPPSIHDSASQAKRIQLPEQVGTNSTAALYGDRSLPSSKDAYLSPQSSTRAPNDTLWIWSAPEALEDPDTEDSDEVESNASDELFFDVRDRDTGIKHPSSDTTVKLWQVYKDNVEPMTKILHVPTVELQIQEFLEGRSDAESEVDVLLYAIYCGAIHSLSDSRCLELFHEPRDDLLNIYRTATRRGLARVKFLSTNSLTVLRAFCIYLIAMRSVYDGRTFWVLTGLGVRMARAMRFQIDGTFSGLSPFRTEMQRRLWYFLIMTDSKAAEFVGSAEKFWWLDDNPEYTKRPTSIDDIDLSPDMVEVPQDSKKITDLSFITLRADFGEYVRNSKRLSEAGGDREDQMRQADKSLEALEDLLRDKYTKHCTPTTPHHLMIAIISTHATDVLRFITHHPKCWPGSVKQAERDMVWQTAMTLLGGFVITNSNPMLAGFRWHMHSSFPWQALVHVLDCLHQQPTGPKSDDAWQVVENIYATHPHFLKQRKRPVHIAVAQLVLKAFHARNQAFSIQGRELRVPEFVQVLQSRQQSLQHKRLQRAASQKHKTFAVRSKGDLPAAVTLHSPPISIDESALTEPSLSDPWIDVDWDEWSKLVSDWESNLDATLH